MTDSLTSEPQAPSPRSEDPTQAVASEAPTGQTGQFPTISVVIPAYNSEGTIYEIAEETIHTLEPFFEKVEIVIVNDGSADQTDARGRKAAQDFPKNVNYIRLARNFGEHNAVMCGLNVATGDCVAIIDDDFQNPPKEILGLVEELALDYDVVYSRYDEKHHHWSRNLGSSFNDWMATRVLGKPAGLYLSSFKVMRRFLVEEVVRYDGPFPYIDGVILATTSAIGSRVCLHAPRAEGQSHYTLGRLVRLWMNMFTNFSIVPLRLASLLGLVTSAFGFVLAVFFMLSSLVGGIFSDQAIPPGWASQIVIITLFAGFQMCLLGMIGEYLGRLLMTENRSPQFVVRETYGKKSDADSDER